MIVLIHRDDLLHRQTDKQTCAYIITGLIGCDSSFMEVTQIVGRIRKSHFLHDIICFD